MRSAQNAGNLCEHYSTLPELAEALDAGADVSPLGAPWMIDTENYQIRAPI